MDLKITLSERQANGLQKVTDAFNVRQGASDNLTPEQYVANEVNHLANGWADQYDIATTGDIAYLKKQIQADPLAVKAALDLADPLAVPGPIMPLADLDAPVGFMARAKSWLGLT